MVTISTPDALWASQTLRHLQPIAVQCRRRAAAQSPATQLLDGLDLVVPVGARLAHRVASTAGRRSLLLRILAA